jgi:microcystin degradation protein MlrC
MGFRVFVGGVWHETNTFSPVATDRAQIASCIDLAGEQLRQSLTGSNTEIGGMIGAAKELSLDLAMGRITGAFPSAPMRARLFEEIVADLVDRAKQAGRLDGALVALHGAMVVEGTVEADAHVVERLRQVLGPDRPIVCTFDFHANLSQALVDRADVLVGYQTNPHLDMGARGREATELMCRLLAGERFHKAFCKLPMVSVSQTQVTADEPMRSVMAQFNAQRRASGIATASVAVGYPYADVPTLGMSTLAYAATQAHARDMAVRLADTLWSRRRDFRAIVVNPAVAVERAIRIAAERRPVILVDVADNIGGGSPGDGTVLLRKLLKAQAPSAAVVIADPQAARAAAATGTGNRFVGTVGGKADRLHGEPVEITGVVRAVRPVSYLRDEEWMTGQRSNQGLTARITVDGVDVVVTEHRTLPYDRRHLREMDIEPANTGILVVKAAAGWRTPFEAMMADAIYCDTPGVNAPNLANFSYHRRPRPLYPLESDAVWSGAG